tara:strand:+ start:381 stop:557 length:177 start_codon:yes stop_codon:yes gene_type:complete
MTNFLSFFFPKAKVIEELIDPREDIEEVKKKEYIFNAKVETEKGNIARKLILEGEKDE